MPKNLRPQTIWQCIGAIVASIGRYSIVIPTANCTCACEVFCNVFWVVLTGLQLDWLDWLKLAHGIVPLCEIVTALKREFTGAISELSLPLHSWPCCCIRRLGGGVARVAAKHSSPIALVEGRIARPFRSRMWLVYQCQQIFVLCSFQPLLCSRSCLLVEDPFIRSIESLSSQLVACSSTLFATKGPITLT